MELVDTFDKHLVTKEVETVSSSKVDKIQNVSNDTWIWPRKITNKTVINDLNVSKLESSAKTDFVELLNNEKSKKSKKYIKVKTNFGIEADDENSSASETENDKSKAIDDEEILDNFFKIYEKQKYNDEYWSATSSEEESGEIQKLYKIFGQRTVIKIPSQCELKEKEYLCLQPTYRRKWIKRPINYEYYEEEDDNDSDTEHNIRIKSNLTKIIKTKQNKMN